MGDNNLKSSYKRMIVVGLDLSLCKTGINIIQDDGKILYSNLVKSKPGGDKPIDEVRRIVKIAEDIVQKIDEVLEGKSPDIIMIEGMAFMAKNTTSLLQIAGLSYLIRILLDEFKWKFCLVSPLTLKKFITGKGKGDKNLIMMQVYKDYGFESLDDNICDSYVLSVCGLALLGKPLKELCVPQKEVINLLKKQL